MSFSVRYIKGFIIKVKYGKTGDIYIDEYSYGNIEICAYSEYFKLVIGKYVSISNITMIMGGMWINGGYYVMNEEIFDYIDDDTTVFEQKPIKMLVNEGRVNAYKHLGFWKPMDTLTDKRQLEEIWNSGNAPWKIWK